MQKNRDKITDLSRSLIEIAWHFGPKGLNDKCCGNLSMPEFLALDKISGTESCAVQEIGRALEFTKSGATRIVNRLVDKGYVKKCISPDDARVCCLMITAEGDKILKDADAGYREKLDRLLKNMPDRDVQQTEELLNSMAKALKR